MKTGDPVDYSKCDTKFTGKWADAESIPMCPTSGDVASIQNQVTADADFIALKLAGTRFVDNGDGTVTDVQTRLMWEQKDYLGGGANLSNPHDADNTYTWSASGTAPDGTVFTDFLSRLNNCDTADGITIAGGFAGHCDWRLPTNAELRTIVDLTATGCATGNPCIFSDLGPTVANYYLSSSTDSSFSSTIVWDVFFYNGIVDQALKTDTHYVRAVRGGL